MWKKILIISTAIILGLGFYFWDNLKGTLPAITPAPQDITDLIPDSNQPMPAVNNTAFPLKLPDGFAISILAKNLSGARDIAEDSFGNLWVSRTSAGVISQIEMSKGTFVRQNDVFRNLDRPHGLAVDGSVLYFAEETKITRVTLYSDDPGQKIADLPKGGRHYTRDLQFGNDGRLYVSIGSTCDVCEEQDERISTIYSMNKDGSDMQKVASGLRNAVFMALNPQSGKIWATEMGRDNLGDNLPPDEINIIEPGPSTSSGQNSVPNFGWPICYGNKIHDTNFDKKQYVRDPCQDTVASHIDLPAHSAPLGLAFVPSNWPSEYAGDLIVAFHGSWNRTVPTGYKLTRLKLNSSGAYEGTEDFISGWLAADGKTSLGRPVGILFARGGSMYVTDDKAGVVYKIQAQSNEIVIEVPAINSIATSPLRLSGKARGNWFFEANAPVKLFDEDGSVLASSFIMAQGEWMTTEFVSFEGKIQFSKPTGKSGTLVFENDNPSGLAENHKEYRLPVKFE